MRMKMILGAVTLTALTLAGCQTAEQSLMSAQVTCQEAGLRPGTKAYGRCTNAAYRQNVAQSQQAANAVAVGAAVGVLGGAAIAASAGHHHHRYYRRCNAWGCW